MKFLDTWFERNFGGLAFKCSNNKKTATPTGITVAKRLGSFGAAFPQIMVIYIPKNGIIWVVVVNQRFTIEDFDNLLLPVE